MEICLYNIQGFRGNYTYVIDDLITIINSKHNGVGKTTLFDCLRFLCDSTQVDKDEQEYFLNLEEQEAMFSVKKNGVTYGFAFQKGRPPVFFRQVEGEELERSDYNFPTASQDIGVLKINDSLINIFSKEVNLFSGSNSAQNYKLVKELTTHQQTEEMLSLLVESINYNQEQATLLRAEKRDADARVQSIPYYYFVDKVEELLTNPFYEEFEDFCDETLTLLERIQEVPEMSFNSKVEEFLEVENSLGRLQLTEFVVPDVTLLENVQEVAECLERLQPCLEVDLDITSLENLVMVSEGLDKLVVSSEESGLNVKPLEQLEIVLSELNNIRVEPEIEVSSILPSTLANVCMKLGEMITACNQEARFTRLATETRASVAGTRVSCPIREEVYLIDGKCVY